MIIMATRKNLKAIEASVLDITKKAMAQVLGEDYMQEHGYLEEISLEKLLEAGKDILDTDARTEQFTKTLLVQVSKIEFMDNLGSMGKEIPMWVNSIEWGGIIERVVFDLPEIMDDPMINPTHGQGATYSAIEHDVYTAPTKAKIFDKFKALMIPITRGGREVLAEAFRSEGEYLTYVSKMIGTVEKAVQEIRVVYSRMLARAGIALSDKATNTAVHLLTEAKAAGLLDSDATADDFSKSQDCWLYTMERIQNMSDDFTETSVAFNNKTVPVGTSKDLQAFVVIGRVMKRINKLVNAKLFNPDVMKFDFYDIPSWQANFKLASDEETVEHFNWETSTSVSIAADPLNTLGYGTDAYNKSNVIGLMYDKRALAVTDYYKKVTSSYTGCTDLTNLFTHWKFDYLVDTDFPMVAFIID